MIDQLISSILQLLVFALIPFIAYQFFYKNKKGYLKYIGLTKAPWKPLLIAFGISVINIVPFLFELSILKPVAELLHDPSSVTGKFHAMGSGVDTMVQLSLVAFIKTALAEEILFRGFIAKRLIWIMGFNWGNVSQALIFGLLHLGLFMTVSQNPVALAYVFVLPTFVALIAAWLNEKMADGSILPGWIAHGFGNFFTYTFFTLS